MEGNPVKHVLDLDKRLDKVYNWKDIKSHSLWSYTNNKEILKSFYLFNYHELYLDRLDIFPYEICLLKVNQLYG